MASLGSNNNYDDMLDHTMVVSGRTQRYAYFVRTWQSNTNISYTNGGWGFSYIKCKFYRESHMGYFYFADNNIEVSTNQWSTSHGGSYGSTVAPTVKYFDQRYRLADSTNTYFTV